MLYFYLIILLLNSAIWFDQFYDFRVILMLDDFRDIVKQMSMLMSRIKLFAAQLLNA